MLVEREGDAYRDGNYVWAHCDMGILHRPISNVRSATSSLAVTLFLLIIPMGIRDYILTCLSERKVVENGGVSSIYWGLYLILFIVIILIIIDIIIIIIIIHSSR